MNGKTAKALRVIAREQGYPYKLLKKAHRGGAVIVKKSEVSNARRNNGR